MPLDSRHLVTLLPLSHPVRHPVHFRIPNYPEQLPKANPPVFSRFQEVIHPLTCQSRQWPKLGNTGSRNTLSFSYFCAGIDPALSQLRGPRTDLENHRPRIRGVPSDHVSLRIDYPRTSRRICPLFEGHRDPQNFVSDPSLGTHL